MQRRKYPNRWINSSPCIGKKSSMQHVFIVGAKGVSFYGGYESFLQKLLEYHKNQKEIVYHIACKANGEGCMNLSEMSDVTNRKGNHFSYLNADCFLVDVPEWMKSAQAIVYDIKALKLCCDQIEKQHIKHPIVYILACRIGPFISRFVKKIHKLGGEVFINPDGHEWKRAKWSKPVRIYWKESERQMVKHADLIVCDSINIESYIKSEYASVQPKTTFIAYGAETRESTLSDEAPSYVEWKKKHQILGDYYLIVGRFVPENNFETMIREFMRSKSEKDLVIITTKNEKMLVELEKNLQYKKDSRIKFVGTVYNQELLTKIREKAYAYLHGHSVGGTNPSLLEALGATKLNILYQIGFNQEVALDAALYFSLEEGELERIINYAEHMSEEEREAFGKKAKERIEQAYSWRIIAEKYHAVFCNQSKI